MDYEALRRSLLIWYEQYGRRLPWRQTKDPYRIWTAEVILQQTQIKQASGYLYRLWEAFPTLEALAEASLEALLTVWQGLGYYQRAHNLHRAARAFVEKGGIPLVPWSQALPALLEVPGIGPYTARAILAFAGDAPLLSVDGNILRVLSRLQADPTPAHLRSVYQARADGFPSAFTGREVSFALMDLAQLVCRPGRPQCPSCPLRIECAAYRSGRPETYPLRSPAPRRPTRFFRMFLYSNCEGVWLHQRPPRGLWGGLWMPPMEETAEPPLRPPDLRHTFTHFQMLAFTEKLEAPLPSTRFVPWTALPHHALPAPIQRYLKRLHNELKSNPDLSGPL